MKKILIIAVVSLLAIWLFFPLLKMLFVAILIIVAGIYLHKTFNTPTPNKEA